MDESAVINASPLIFFSRAEHLALLRDFADRIIAPTAVADEIAARGPNDISAIAIKDTSWIEVVPQIPVPEEIACWGLGPGESSVLAFAVANRGMTAIIDDLGGRKCAAGLNIPVRGTLGIVLAAKRRGVIHRARPILEDLIASGLYLHRRVLDEALKRVDE